MKVVAINASPRTDKGNTAIILQPFLDGMREAGAEVEVFYTKKLDIKPCQGEFNCWFKSPGKCFQADDVEMLHSKMRVADVWVFACPLYVWGLPGPLKNLLDRCIPLVQPYFDLTDGHCRHPRREGVTEPQVVLVANCGFWELDNFDALLKHMKDFLGDRFAGALLRPHGPALATMLEMGMPVQDVLEAAKEAGQEMAHDRRMNQETLNRVSRELLPLQQYVELVNQEFRRNLDRVKAHAMAT